MIFVRKSAERRREQAPGQDAWLAFGPDAAEPRGTFRSMEVFREGRFVPRTASRETLRESEIITYVREGSLAFEDSHGQTGVLRAGDFQLMTAGLGLSYSEMNVSPVQAAHVFQIRLHPNRRDLEPGYEKRRFTVAQRKGRLCLVASPDGADGSLVIHQSARLYSAILAPGQVVVHPLSVGRGAWLHVVHGSLRVASVVLSTGDSAGISDTASASMAMREDTEILLLDLGGFDAQQERDNGKAAGIESRKVSSGNGGASPFSRTAILG